MAEWTMDMWKYFDVTHRHHVVCNPMSVAKIDQLLDLCRLPDGAMVVDVACGKGEILVRLAERTAIAGTGVDISPFAVADAERLRDARVHGADLEFVCKGGADWVPATPESYDLACCIGAEWVWGGLAPTCRALHAMVKPGGLAIIGTPYWLAAPPAEYLEWAGMQADDFAPSLAAGLETCEAAGFEQLYSVVSTTDDWDHYEGLQWFAAEEFGREHSDDPDVEEIRTRVRRSRTEYVRWGRDHCNWGLHLLRRQ